MKKSIRRFATVVLICCAAFMVLVAAGSLYLRKMDRESKAFFDAAVPAIAKGWDMDELIKRASPEFVEAMDPDGMEQYFVELQQLGDFVANGDSDGEAALSISIRRWCETTADFRSQAEFEAGTAEVRISLVREDGKWRIYDLSVSPAMFADRQDVI
jgi:hypothetical protein